MIPFQFVLLVRKAADSARHSREVLRKEARRAESRPTTARLPRRTRAEENRPVTAGSDAGTKAEIGLVHWLCSPGAAREITASGATASF